VTVQIIEQPVSRSGRSSIAKDTQIDYTWRLKGSDSLTGTILDPIWGYTLEPSDLRWSRIGYQLYDFTMTYADQAWIDENRQLDTGESRFSYSTTGGTLRIFTSLETAARYAAPGYQVPAVVAGEGSPIGVTDETVEGVDIVIPAMQFHFDFRYAKATITPAYMKSMMDATGTTNDALWLSLFPANSVLFMGAEGSQGIKSDPTHRHSFVYSKNLTDQVIGAITGIAKKGHEYVWVVHEETIDATSKRKTKKPIQVHVEKVYEESNFSTLFPF